jgi:hypothetical protein
MVPTPPTGFEGPKNGDVVAGLNNRDVQFGAVGVARMRVRPNVVDPVVSVDELDDSTWTDDLGWIDPCVSDPDRE